MRSPLLACEYGHRNGPVPGTDYLYQDRRDHLGACTSTPTPINPGGADDLPEQAFLYVGDIEEVRAKAKEMK